MGKGQEYVKRVQEALDGFEKAVVRRENKGLMESKVALQQEVDRAREHVLEVVAKIVAEERLRAGQ
ncbi:MAG: hypothetical protein KatS3mg081_2135 [Gemmatimonadales bacterium]|nr:hypothetical protein HRbin33_01099 [bacterium HR33]GIW52780.1 MAG: hypothetical protein KatS3mg081_2135 [Gemmatimonadales bacterium]